MTSEAGDEVPDLVNASSDEATDRAQLADLIAQATSKYAVKDYNPAAELYSQATELQATLNGEMAIENADLLYSYGKCLYFVGVSKSDVLGTEAAGKKVGNVKEEKKTKGKRADKIPKESEKDQQVAEEVVAQIATGEQAGESASLPGKSSKEDEKPFFQFQGDENWDDSDDEDAEEEAEDDEEDDDFSTAFEILDIARVLFEKKLNRLEEVATESAGKGKGSEAVDTPETRQVKERLADTHDLQAEISLEGERFPNAVADLKATLALKLDLCPQESSQIAECHYKLSLALEFASVTQQKDENGEVVEGTQATVDEAMREEAAVEMEKAIASCELRVKKEQAEVDNRSSGTASDDSGKKQITQKEIDEVKEMVADMKQRLIDLRAPPVSINDPTSTGSLDGATPLNGILGQLLGESADEQKKRLDEASKNANDLSGLVKRKKPKPTTESSPAPTNGHSHAEVTNGTNGKRKLEEEEALEDAATGKKAKVEEV